MPRKVNPKSLENLKKRKPFVKGDPRINRLGRASNFDQLRKLFQEIANEEIQDGEEIKTRIRKIGEQFATDKKLLISFLEFAYGKVPTSLDVTTAGKSLTWREFLDGNGDSESTGENRDTKTSSE